VFRQKLLGCRGTDTDEETLGWWRHHAEGAEAGWPWTISVNRYVQNGVITPSQHGASGQLDKHEDRAEKAWRLVKGARNAVPLYRDKCENG
jgi:hypothetical protein